MNPLKAFRKRHNLTQVEASATLGYNVNTWRQYENGIRDTPKHVLVHITHYNALQDYKEADAQWKAAYDNVMLNLSKSDNP